MLDVAASMFENRKSKKQRLRTWAGLFFGVPLIFMAIPLYGALYRPSLLLDNWTVYILFVGLPWLVSIMLWRRSLRSSEPLE